jgi:hypothetical protein
MRRKPRANRILKRVLADKKMCTRSSQPPGQA